MAYIIDGHNLIGVLPDIQLNQPDDESRLLDKLRFFRAYRGGGDMVVFFDSGPAGAAGGPGELFSTPGLEVRFSGAGQTADDAIVLYLRRLRQPGQFAVVTNDHGLADRARALGASILSASEFAQQMQRKPDAAPRGVAGEPSAGLNPRDPAFADLYDAFLAAEKRAKTSKQGRADVETWIERLYTADPQLAQRAAQWLGENGADAAIEPLRDALTHRDPGVRAAAALALGATRRRSATADLCHRLLEDGNSMVREAAAQTLGLLGDRRAIDALETAAARDTKGKVRKAAAFALAQIRARQ